MRQISGNEGYIRAKRFFLFTIEHVLIIFPIIERRRKQNKFFQILWWYIKYFALRKTYNNTEQNIQYATTEYIKCTFCPIPGWVY